MLQLQRNNKSKIIVICMLKPKSQVFKVKFHLAKVQAASNRVNSKVHACIFICTIQNQQLQFKGEPQLKKNIAIFGSDLQYENFMIGYDQITGLYQQKRVLLVIQFQTQGSYIKVGEVSVNMGEILNQKKYRVVNVYPLAKCYDKSARVKLAVDFIPMAMGEKRQVNISTNGKKMMVSNGLRQSVGERKQQSSNIINQQSQPPLLNNTVGSGFYKNPTGIIKSRLAQEQNVILQQRLYQYQKKMDSYRVSQGELSQKMQQQLQRKQQKISQLSLQLNKQQNIIHLVKLQNQNQKNQIKRQSEQIQQYRQQNKLLIVNNDQLKKLLLSKQKQLQSRMLSLQNLTRTKQNKQKHLLSQVQKYTSKYSQSQLQKNKIIFQLQNKLKQQLQKKDHHYQELLNSNQLKFMQNVGKVKQRNKYLEELQKQMEESNSEKESRVKSLQLELRNLRALYTQQQQEMVYLNQQLTKTRNKKQLLSNELDSITFSYHQTVTELTTQQQLSKQLIQKLQLTKTELKLSNQTIDQHRQKITIINKDLQVHQQRQYYMKEHYQEELYERELTQNTLGEEKLSLVTQLTRLKQQLKINEEKLQETNSKNTQLNSTIQTLQRDLTLKNSTLIKLAEEKLHQQTQMRNNKHLIEQLQQQLNKLQQQKAYLTEAIMEKKITLQNDNSLQWTYKIQSLQNDIQVMVDKFKQEKDSIKDYYKKEEGKKIQEINKLNGNNIKLKEDIDQVKDKLLKRQNYISGVEKMLKNQKDKSLQLQRQLLSIKQSYRLIFNQKESYEQGLKQVTRQKESLYKQVQQLQRHCEKLRKQSSKLKTGFNRLISLILQQLVKRYNQRVSFQQISLDIVGDGEIVSYVNVALRKFCDDHNRNREMIKELQKYKAAHEEKEFMGKRHNNSKVELQQEGDNYQAGQNPYNNQYISNKYQHQESTYQQHSKRKQHIRTHTTNNTNSPTFIPITNNFPTDPTKQLQSYRKQVDRLRKQQSQSRVKMKQLQEQMEKHQRNVENGKFQLKRSKSQLEETQDQVTRLNFVVRKKDKIIKQLEMELQDIQKENFMLQTNTTIANERTKDKPTQQPPATLQNISSPMMRDLELKLNLKSQQLMHVQRQIQSLRGEYLMQLNEIKKLQNRLKQKTQRIVTLEKQLQSHSLRKNDQKEKENLKLQKLLQNKQQQKQLLEQKTTQLQTIIKDYQQQLNTLQQRNNDLHQQLKLTENQFKRNLQSTEYLINDKTTLYQTDILQLNSQLSQQKDTCVQLALKNSQLVGMVNKKTLEIQALKEKLAAKERENGKVEELHYEEKSKMVLKLNAFSDRIRELQNTLENKQFQLEQCKFTYQGKILELEKIVDDFREQLRNGTGSPR